MKKINLNDGTTAYCLKQNEAIVLDDHIKGYLKYGIKINEGDVIIDIGANIGILGLRLSQSYHDITIHAFEPIPEIHKVLKKNSEISQNPKFNTFLEFKFFVKKIDDIFQKFIKKFQTFKMLLNPIYGSLGGPRGRV